MSHKEESKAALVSLEKELETVNLDLDQFDKDIEVAVQECSDSKDTSVIKEKEELIGQLVVKVRGAKCLQAEIMQQITEHSEIVAS